MYERALEVIDQITTDTTVKSIINSTNKRQTQSKLWLVKEARPYLEMIPEPNICVMAGWYGHLASLLCEFTSRPVISVDMDKSCQEIGRKLQKGKNIKFRVKTMEEWEPVGYNVNVCTSCEHIPQKQIDDYLKRTLSGTLKILQSNNYYKIEEHINCRESLDDFVKDYNPEKLLFKGELDLEEYKRFMIIFV